MSKKNKPNLSQSKPTATANLAPGKPIGMQYGLLLVLAVSFIVFIPALSGQFINYDDPDNILKNPTVVNFGFGNMLESIRDIFSTTILGNYIPLTILSFAIEKMIFGIGHPFFWHLDNVLLHLISVALVYRIVQKMNLSSGVALLVALLFGIHPMRVESVAWITERKDILYTLFYLAAVYHYLKYSREGIKKSAKYVLIFFVLSMLSKIQGVLLPASLLLFDYYFSGKITLKDITGKWLYLALAAAMGLTGLYFLKQVGALWGEQQLNLLELCLLKCHTLVVYLIKCIFPYRMDLIYPMPLQLDWKIFLSALVVPLLGWAIYKSWKAGQRTIVFGLLFFMVNIVLVLQTVAGGQGYQDDRFTYLAYLGLFLLMAEGFTWLQEKAGTSKQLVQYVVYAYLALLGIVCMRQNSVWENSETVWTDVLENYKVSTAYFNRGLYYHDVERYDEALKDYDAAIALEKTDPAFYYSRSGLYFMSAGDDINKVNKALEDINTAIKLSDKNAFYYANRASINGRLGNIPAALEDANKSIGLDPDCAEGYAAAFMCYATTQRFPEALKMGGKYLELRPGDEQMEQRVDEIKRMVGK